jgi:hypothetical protein
LYSYPQLIVLLNLDLDLNGYTFKSIVKNLKGFSHPHWPFSSEKISLYCATFAYFIALQTDYKTKTQRCCASWPFYRDSDSQNLFGFWHVQRAYILIFHHFEVCLSLLKNVKGELNNYHTTLFLFLLKFVRYRYRYVAKC